VKGGPDIGQVLADWFERCVDELVTGKFADLLKGLPLPFLEPAAARAHTAACYVSVGADAGRVYSAESWAWLLRSLRDQPSAAGFQMSTFDSDGRPTADSVKILALGVLDAPGWWLLVFESGDLSLREPANQWRMCSVLRGFAERWPGITHGEVSYVTAVNQAALEAATSRYSWQTIPRSTEELRSYSWVTVVNPELAGILGVERLRGSGAFVEVDVLRSGAVWLRATTDWNNYDLPAAERVFEALSPVLPQVLPTGDAGYNPVVMREPARPSH
jgi:hypothetical protein